MLETGKEPYAGPLQPALPLTLSRAARPRVKQAFPRKRELVWYPATNRDCTKYATRGAAH